MKFARLDANSIVLETWTPPDWKPDMLPSEVFTPNLVFIQCPDEVDQGWTYVEADDQWFPPAPAMLAASGDTGNGNPPPPP